MEIKKGTNTFSHHWNCPDTEISCLITGMPLFFKFFFFYENWLIVRLLFAEIVLIYSVFTTVVGTFFLTVLFTSSSLCLHFPDTRHALYPVCDLISNVSHAGRCFRPQIVLFLVKITSTTNYTDYLWGEKMWNVDAAGGQGLT